MIDLLLRALSSCESYTQAVMLAKALNHVSPHSDARASRALAKHSLSEDDVPDEFAEQLLMRPVDDYEVVSALLKCMWDLLIRPVHEESPLVSGILAKVLKKHAYFSLPLGYSVAGAAIKSL